MLGQVLVSLEERGVSEIMHYLKVNSNILTYEYEDLT